MLRKLFARLTAEPARGAPLFEAVVAEARKRHWFTGGAVADTVDGRFAVLATVLALATVRLEQGGAGARSHSAALAERFVAAMDAEHRQMGVGDPAIGKTVRRLVAALSNRVELWRETIAGGEGWAEAASRSLYRGSPPTAEALAHAQAGLRELWQKLEDADDEALIDGRIR